MLGQRLHDSNVGVDDGANPGESNETSNLSDNEGGQIDPNAPTWHRDIAPLMVEKCGECHRPGSVGPMRLDTYESVSQWSSAAILAIESGSMPPFAARVTEACQPRFAFTEDLSLSVEQIDLLKRWQAAGHPHGDPATASLIPQVPDHNLVNPSWQAKMPKPVMIEPGIDKHLCMVIDPQITTTMFFDGIQIVPGNANVVHHVLVFSGKDETLPPAAKDGVWECPGGGLIGESLVGAWAPGALPTVAPPNTATVLEPGTKLVLNIHYHPTADSSELDSETALRLRWFNGVPSYVSSVALIGNFDRYDAATHTGLLPGSDDLADPSPKFRIPANVANHSEKQIFELKPDNSESGEILIWGVGSHMHYIGTDLKMELERKAPLAGEPARECLLHTPYWDFNWQRTYYYKAPLAEVPRLRFGDRLAIDCHYNNTLGNPKAAQLLKEQGLDAPVDVFLGEGSLDEMCLGVFAIAVKMPESAISDLAAAIAQTKATLRRLTRPWPHRSIEVGHQGSIGTESSE